MMEQRKVLSWRFEDSGEVKAAVVKNNKIIIITDGDSLCKVTFYESLSNKMELNQEYVVRGYSLRGGSPPYTLNISKEMEFFKSAPIHVVEGLRCEAQKMLQPTSTSTALSCKSTQGLITVEVEVVQVSTFFNIYLIQKVMLILSEYGCV